VTKDDKEIMSVLRKRMADRVGQERFELWFSAGVDFEVHGAMFRVLATNAFALERLRKSFREDLEAVAVEVLGRAATLQFRLADGDGARHNGKANSAPVSVKLSAPQASISAAKATASSRPSPTPPPPTSDRARRTLASLDAFVVGDTNRLAYAAARSVELRLGQVSPLFIHGPTGGGKSHLIEGICAAVRQRSRERRVVSLTAEQFTTYFIEALNGKGLPMFRRKYRDVDLLLIDDVQFFAGKKATLVELQYTIDTLARGGKQLVLAADRPPQELGNLGPELVARMAGGLVVGLEPADEPTRLGILRHLAVRSPVAMPADVLQWLAQKLPGDARQLQGALHRIAASSEAFGQPVTLELATTAVKDLVDVARRAVQLPDIERAICSVFGIAADQLHAEKRSRNVSWPRMLAMWLARKHTRAALAEIGEYFGHRSHSTVIAAHNSVERWRSGGEWMPSASGDCHVDDAIRRVEAELRLA
jgi:chromosomal replication initiator protein